MGLRVKKEENKLSQAEDFPQKNASAFWANP